MNTGLRPLFAVLAPTLFLACGDDASAPVPASPDGYPFAYASTACGPTDGPATRLFLAADSVGGLPTDRPRLEIGIYRSAADLQGESLHWSASSPDAWAGRCTADGTCEEAASTSVKFRRNAADTALSGTVALRFADGTSVIGGFEAMWRRTDQLCG